MLTERGRQVWDLLGLGLLVGWFTLVNGWETTRWLLLAAVLHELCHWLVLLSLGGEGVRLRLSPFGAVMETAELRLSYPAELAAVLAGPAGNFAAAAGLAVFAPPEEQALAVGANCVLGLFNLFPAAPLDGWRALELAGCWLLGPDRGCLWAGRIGALASAALCGGILWLVAASGGNLWLLPAALCVGRAGVRAVSGEKSGQ